MNSEKTAGKVCLVGAGPGEPGWITVRGLELLRRADVVVFDALANPVLLEEARPDAERIDVGKRARDHKLPQEQINQLLVDKARTGALVVRLKGGDPYLFGRGAEEVSFVAREGIAVEVVPGITSGIGAPLAAGIPVTHRDVASSLTFVTGHEDPTKAGSAVDYRALAGLVAAGGTVCFYMGVARLGAISESLQSHGLAGSTPAALVQWGSTPRQRTLRTTLARAVADQKAAGIGSPAIIVVGAVAAIEEPGLDFFIRRPLFGQRIVVTRTRQQASELKQRLLELGADVIEAPTIALAPPADWGQVDAAVRDIRQYHWAVLTSANGVHGLADRLEAQGLDSRHLHGVKFAAIGGSTAAALKSRLGIRADLVPTEFVAESLAGELIARHAVKGKKFLLLRAEIGRPTLPKALAEAGAEVTEVTVYRTLPAGALPPEVPEALKAGTVDWVTFTSSSTARNLVEMLGPDRALLEKVKIASIGPVTSQTLRDLGLGVTIEGASATIEGLVAALVEAS